MTNITVLDLHSGNNFQYFNLLSMRNVTYLTSYIILLMKCFRVVANVYHFNVVLW